MRPPPAQVSTALTAGLLALAVCGAPRPAPYPFEYERHLAECEARAYRLLGDPPQATDDVRTGQKRLMTGHHPERVWLRMFQNEVAGCMARKGWGKAPEPEEDDAEADG